MKRGEIWTVAGGPGYTGKPRPAVIVQEDAFAPTGSVTVVPFTTMRAPFPTVRITVMPTAMNGLIHPCSLMPDKITTLPRVLLGTHVGHLETISLARLGQALVAFLGLASGSR